MTNIFLEDYLKLCRSKLIEAIGSKTYAWKSLDGDEAIEFIAGKIILSKIITMKDGSKEKVICEKVESKEINSVIEALTRDKNNNSSKDIQNDAKNSTQEKRICEETFLEIKQTSCINDIPSILEEKQIITPQNLDAWKKLSTFERILLFQKTPKALIKKRRGYLLPEYAGLDKKTLTDKHFKMFQYLDSNTMKLSANIAFLFQWSCVVESEKYFDDEICVRGYIQVEIDGKMYRRSCGGSCKKKGMMDWGDAMEGAISEMTKRGIYHFLHGDVKRGEFDEN